MKTNQLRHAVLSVSASLLIAAPAAATDGLRVVNWNISNYSGGRDAALSTAIYGVFEGRSMDPDVICAEEIQSQGAADALLAILNNAAGSPGDWAAAPFVNGPDTDSAMFYRTSKVDYLGMSVLPADPGTSGAPRNIYRYDIELNGYGSSEGRISMYALHMKAGSASSDQARRLIEATRVRDDAETLDPSVHIMIMGDFNIQSSNQAAYIEFTGSQANNNGRVVDPINTPGSWNNNGSFNFVHTQDPVGAGGMDDRHDQILVDPSLGDGFGTEYRGVFQQTYSTTTWNDPDHSYRAWGNDGSSFNAALTTVGNTMVGPTIAQALISVAAGAGHLPVFLDLVVPAVVDAPFVIDFGAVGPGQIVGENFEVGSAANFARWGATGAADTEYTLEALGTGLSTDAGVFADAPDGPLNSHTAMIDTSMLPMGPFEFEIRVHSNDPDNPVVSIPVTGAVIGCPADLAAPMGVLNFFDIQAFITLFNATDPAADLAAPFGTWNFFDIQAYIASYNAGCP